MKFDIEKAKAGRIALSGKGETAKYLCTLISPVCPHLFIKTYSNGSQEEMRVDNYGHILRGGSKDDLVYMKAEIKEYWAAKLSAPNHKHGFFVTTALHHSSAEAEAYGKKLFTDSVNVNNILLGTVLVHTEEV